MYIILDKHPALNFFKEVQKFDPRIACLSTSFNLDNDVKNFSNILVPLEEIAHYRALLKNIDKDEFSMEPIDFWKIQEPAMPVLSSLAVKALMVPSSSAHVERSFSYLKMLLTPHSLC